MELKGKITSDQILELRFSNGGKISQLNFQVGQTVTKSFLLARQDQSQLQTYLDRALKYYEQVRASFDEKHTKDQNEFDTRVLQAELDVSVKNVEIAKQNLENSNLYAPTSGIIIAADPIAVGGNITPGAFTITILDPASLYFQALVPEKDLKNITPNAKVSVKLAAFDNSLEGKIVSLGYIADKEGNIPVHIELSDKSNLRLNFSGIATL